MGKITEWIKDYRAGKLSFDELKEKSVAFDGWEPSERSMVYERDGPEGLDDYGDIGFPEENTLDELDAAEIEELLTEEEAQELYGAVVGDVEDVKMDFTPEEKKELYKMDLKNGLITKAEYEQLLAELSEGVY